MADSERPQHFSDAPERRAGIGFPEFVALCAAIIALGALGIDTMLPALPAIGQGLGAASPADWPLVITAFVLGFGLAQPIHGPLADRYGRRPVLLWSLGIYIVATLVVTASSDFTLLLVARFVGGVAVASTRVVPIAMVRDLHAGRAMAKVTSLIFMVFMAVPVLAPALGQGILVVGSWRLIFGVIAVFALIVLGWFAWRMPETLTPERRVPISVPVIAANWKVVLTDRLSLGYMLAATAMQGALYGYLNTIQAIVDRTFGAPDMLAAVFAGAAVLLACANLLNSRIVMRFGTRRISQTAVLALIVTSLVALAVEGAGYETLWTFTALQAVTLACFGLTGSNFSAMAMERMGDIAGTASSVQGFVSVTGGALLGAAVGLAFDGTTTPLHLAFLIASVTALGIVAIVERGRMFQPTVH
ncbi:MAG: multidrug effflux MFS transporter [Pseudomonadota bacterium]